MFRKLNSSDILFIVGSLVVSIAGFHFGNSKVGGAFALMFVLVTLSYILPDPKKKEIDPGIKAMLDGVEAVADARRSKRISMPKNSETEVEVSRCLDSMTQPVMALVNLYFALLKDRNFMASFEEHYYDVEEFKETNKAKKSQVLRAALRDVFLSDVLLRSREIGRKVTLGCRQDSGFAALMVELDGNRPQGKSLLNQVVEVLTSEDKNYNVRLVELEYYSKNEEGVDEIMFTGIECSKKDLLRKMYLKCLDDYIEVLKRM